MMYETGANAFIFINTFLAIPIVIWLFISGLNNLFETFDLLEGLTIFMFTFVVGTFATVIATILLAAIWPLEIILLIVLPIALYARQHNIRNTKQLLRHFTERE